MTKESRPVGQHAVSLRPATEEDMPLLYQAYASTREVEMALLPWNAEQREAFLRMQFSAQLHHYRTYHPNATHDIILLGDEPVGRIYVSREEADDIRILDVTVLQEYRSLGIGTPLIRALMEEAARECKSLSIHVENYNPSHRLFERLGFVVIEDDGLNHLMQWRAPARVAGAEEGGASPQ